MRHVVFSMLNRVCTSLARVFSNACFTCARFAPGYFAAYTFLTWQVPYTFYVNGTELTESLEQTISELGEPAGAVSHIRESLKRLLENIAGGCPVNSQPLTSCYERWAELLLQL